MKLEIRLLALLALSLPLAAACGDAGDGPDASAVDTTAPTVVSITPEDGATGQLADIEVVIVFSEKMDRVTVDGALDAGSMGPVNLIWNDADDTLTIIPETPLAYAVGSGNDPGDVEANAYSLVLGKEAEDVAGNQLGTDLEIEFTTLKRMSMTLEPATAWSRVITPTGLFENFNTEDPFGVGDTSGDIGVRSAITFDLSLLPGSTHSIESATFATRQMLEGISGTPFADLGSAVLLDHVTYPELVGENAINAAYNSSQTALSELGALYTQGQVVVELDVSDAVADDFEHVMDRGYRSQFLARFELATNEDASTDGTVFSRELLELQVDYLHP